MILSHWLMRAAARVTLASYLTQLFAPVVWAMEVEGPSDRFGIRSQRGPEQSPPREAALQRSFRRSLELGSWERLAAPSPEAQAKARGILEALQPTPSGYQYRLRVKTLDAQNEEFMLKLSRKAKGASGHSEKLYKTKILEGRLGETAFSDSSDVQADALLNLFRGGFVHKLTNHGDTVCFAWNVPGVGTLKVARDGAVTLDQDDAVPFLSSYDLIVKTTGKLSIASLAVANLTLKSRETEILMMGAVSADRLSIDRQCKLANEGGLRAKQITGQGKLENHGILRLEGTREEPSILDVKQVLNKKSTVFPIEPKIEASHLRITSGNQSFYNGESAELQATGTLVVDPFDGSNPSSFTNKGRIRLHEAQINREAVNAGFWEAFQMAVEEKAFTNRSLGTLKILDYLTVNSHLLNEGEMKVENLLRAKTGVNKGTLKGDGLMLGVEASFENEGYLSAKAILGDGSFLNRKTLNLVSSEANPAHIGVRSFANRNLENKSPVAQVKARNVVVTKTNQQFSNGEKSELLVDHLSFSYDAENPRHFLVPEKDIQHSWRTADN